MKYKLITLDLDDTFWDIAPVIIKAEKDTRAWLRKTVGEIEWGSMSDFMGIREDLIKAMPSLDRTKYLGDEDTTFIEYIRDILETRLASEDMNV